MATGTQKPITYEDITSYYEANRDNLYKIGQEVENLIIQGRDNESIPVYVTKMRLKSPESLYLKTKRKSYRSIEDITDLIGMRALCLFEQDIEPTFVYLTQIFSDIAASPKSYTLTEITFFNWPTHVWGDRFPDAMRRMWNTMGIESHFERSEAASNEKTEWEIYCSQTNDNQPLTHKITYRAINRGSGYKSIHFIVRHKKFSFELQLRTLLQDVWGELEHSLSYKNGFVHPHIINSFQIFARELQAKDELMSQLRETRDRDLAFEQIDNRRSGPSHWLDFEPQFVDQVFTTSATRSLYEDYVRIGKSYVKPNVDDSFIEKLRDSLSKIRKALEEKPLSREASHWLDMESAFIKFCEGDHEGAKAIYLAQLDRQAEINHQLWAVHYRLGELLIIDSDNENVLIQALVHFDKCEALLGADPESGISHRERYFVNSKLAYIYWKLGLEYIDIAIAKMGLAETHFKKLDAADGNEDKATLARLMNNLCYYHTENWINCSANRKKQQRQEQRFAAKTRYSMLAKLLEEAPEVAAANLYDTLAWFCYNMYLDLLLYKDDRDSNPYQYLKLAHTYLMQSIDKQSFAISAFTSEKLRRRHAEVILTEYGKAVTTGAISVTA